jgi:glutamyl-tRNA synthetase
MDPSTATLAATHATSARSHQSQRREHYDRFFKQLLDAELAYPAFETPEELAAMRKAAEAEKKTFIYRQPADYDHSAALKRAETDEHVLRFRCPPSP